MRSGRGILLLLLVSSLTFLASLYLQWITVPTVYAESSTYTNASIGGWFAFGEPAGLLALGLAGVAAASLARPSLAARLEGWLSVALCLFLLALGWIERTRGLKGFRVPAEIWQIDRLPGES